MKEVWIFGDSYADLQYFGNSHSWPVKLNNQFSIKNLALVGSGPDYQLSLFLKEIDNCKDDLSEISVIFLISSIHRINFQFLDPTTQSFTRRVIIDTVFPFFSGRMPSDNNQEFTKKFVKDYITHSTYDKTELNKIICLLKEYSRQFEKILVWPIFNEPTIPIADSEKFHLVNDLLYDFEKVPDEMNETRDNHLSEFNHFIMFTQISEWIAHGTPIDTAKFTRINY